MVVVLSFSIIALIIDCPRHILRYMPKRKNSKWDK